MNANNITGKRYEDHLREAGFTVEPPVKNQGKGAAMMRIEALRRLGPQLWWNEATTEPGRDAIGFYHERKDDTRNVGLGPEHDWSSHAADALGLMAICYEEPGRAGTSTGRFAMSNPGGGEVSLGAIALRGHQPVANHGPSQDRQLLI